MQRMAGIWIAVLAASASFADAPKPDFSGTWQLDPLRSRYNPTVPAPKSATLMLEHHGSNLRVDLTMAAGKDPEHYTFELVIDGAEVSQTTGGRPYSALAQWGDIDGTRLILTIKQDTPSGTVETSRIMRLGDKGKILTTVLTIKDSSGERKANEFYTK